MDEGVAHLCYVKSSITLIRSKVEKSIPKKKSGAELQQKAMRAFFKLCFDQLLTVNFQQIKCLIIASPGFVKDDFLKYIRAESQSEQFAAVFKKNCILEKILLVAASSGYKNALTEVLEDKAVQAKMEDTKAVREVRVLEQFYKTMMFDQDRITYGIRNIRTAQKAAAIAVLLLSDALFRTNDLEKRKEYTSLFNKI